jgi:hypothetical protein
VRELTSFFTARVHDGPLPGVRTAVINEGVVNLILAHIEDEWDRVADGCRVAEDTR